MTSLIYHPARTRACGLNSSPSLAHSLPSTIFSHDGHDHVALTTSSSPTSDPSKNSIFIHLLSLFFCFLFAKVGFFWVQLCCWAFFSLPFFLCHQFLPMSWAALQRRAPSFQWKYWFLTNGFHSGNSKVGDLEVVFHAKASCLFTCL